MGSAIKQVLCHNEKFVKQGAGESFCTGKKPKQRLALVACMDTRLTTMLVSALGLENGDAVIVKVAGAEISNPYDPVVRSLLVAIYELDVREVMIVAHTECGAQHMSCSAMTSLMRQQGITETDFETVKASGVNLDEWLEGFGDTEASVHKSIQVLKNHPLVPSHIDLQGFVIETQTGELTRVV